MKILFWLYLITVAPIVLFVGSKTSGGLDTSLCLFLALSLANLAGFYGLAYRKLIGSVFFWKCIFAFNLLPLAYGTQLTWNVARRLLTSDSGAEASVGLWILVGGSVLLLLAWICLVPIIAVTLYTVRLPAFEAERLRKAIEETIDR